MQFKVLIKTCHRASILVGAPLLKYSISAYSTTSDRVIMFHIPSPRYCHLLGPRQYTFSVVTPAFGTLVPLRSFHMDKAYPCCMQRSIWQSINSPIGKQLWDCTKGYFVSKTGQEKGRDLFLQHLFLLNFPSSVSISERWKKIPAYPFSDAKHTFHRRRSSLNFVKCMPSYS